MTPGEWLATMLGGLVLLSLCVSGVVLVCAALRSERR